MAIAKIDTINELYKAYHNDIKRLLAYVEAELEEFPIAILNEIRSLYDHTARACLSKNNEAKCQEIESAKRHIIRIKLDCCKVLCAQGEIRMEEFHKNYKRIRLGEVDSGNFLPELTQLHDKAKKTVRRAKHAEKSGEDGREETFSLFQEAVVAYKDVERFIEDNSEKLAWAASRQRRYFWSNHIVTIIITFVIGVAAGCLSMKIMEVLE